MNAITQDRNETVSDGSRSSSAPVSISSCEQREATQCLFGDDSLMTVVRPESTAPCSATSHATLAVSLSDRLMQSLISAGLIAGITPLSIRKRYGQAILDFASSKQDGNDVGERKAGC